MKFKELEKSPFPVRKEIKTKAKNDLRGSWAVVIVLCILFSIVTSGSFSSSDSVLTPIQILDAAGEITGSKKLEKFSESLENGLINLKKATSFGDDSSAGLTAKLYKNYRRSENSIFNAVFQSIVRQLSKKVNLGFYQFVIFFLLLLLTYLFILVPVRIGVYRFFMEKTAEHGDIKRIVPYLLFAYRSGYFINISLIMLNRLLYLFFWTFTIAGLPIKYFSYYQIPYLLAENPAIKRKEAFFQSRQMMRGNKFKFLLFFISFLPWYMLSGLTFGLLRYFYLDPYFSAAKANIYISLRRDNFNCISIIEKKPFEVEKINYSILNLNLIFFIFCFIGWIWEVVLVFVQTGDIVNRGSLYGPWIPIYGVGGMLVIILLSRFKIHPVVVFLLTMLLCGIVEYASATYLYDVKHMMYWNYHGYFLNIQGRVCLEGLIAFGMLGTLSVYFVGPFANELLNKIPHKIKIAVASVLSIAFISDIIYSQFYPHVGPDIGEYTKK
ncbi:MAG: DUF975 family protein [Clostridiales Family XIII bacterium]|jgi:uncharacterized membrane protein|nr:DUF975 family protein [Clostridiales Family XIII bacterium]